ncbi:MAG: AAA family ATPase [Gammaproteobacteria bacterium]|nr:AAA family ATPase [Gammaproteobacteria bacterium]
MAFRFNEEQTAILDHLHYRDSQILAVNALAGTGKTTTLKGAAQYPLKAERLRYFVFNRRNADEAAAEFPNNTTTSTAHSFAFRAPHPDGGGTMAEVYGASTPRLFSGSLYGPLRDQMKQSTEFADRIRQIRQELRCSEGRAIMAVQSVLRQYCQSADEQIGPQHIAPDLADYIHRQGLRGSPKATLGTAAWAWDRMRDPFSQFPIDHGVYLKLCSLAPPRIPADTILFDEAQDASPPMLAILKAQLQYGTRLVLVGDTYQHIYDFTGAVDAMEVMRKDHPDLTQTLPLSTSYRFGQDVADAGNHVLRLMGSPYLLTGKGPDSQVIDDQVGNVHAVLFRGNAGLLQAAVQAVVAGQRIHVVGGTGEIVNLVEAMGRLYKNEFAKHPELSFFDSWHQLSEYAQTPLGSNFAPLVKIVEQKQGQVADVAQALRNTETDPARAQYVLSTGHKSKGGQWNNVLLMDDFQRSWLNTDPDGERLYQVPGDDALCLQYVACTRAQTTLYTNGLLNTMERALGEEQSYDGAAQKALRERIPEVLAGIEAWKNPPLQGANPLQGDNPVTEPSIVPDVSLRDAPWIVGLSGEPGAGKDTVADMLIAQVKEDGGKAVKLAFGNVLYQDVAAAYGIPVYRLQDRHNKDLPATAMARAYCKNPEMVEALKDRGDNQPLSPREVLQLWGDYRRSQNPHYLIDQVREQAAHALTQGQSVVISDLRTVREVALIQEMGGMTVRVQNPEITERMEYLRQKGDAAAIHPLENALRNVPMDAEIVNNGTLENLQSKVHDLYAHIRSQSESPLQDATLSPGATPKTSVDSIGDSAERNAFVLNDPVPCRQQRLFALADSLESARAGRFTDGPSSDLAELVSFGNHGTFLAECFPDKAPMILGQLTDKSRDGFLRSFCKSDDPLASIEPSEEAQVPQFGYGRRP